MPLNWPHLLLLIFVPDLQTLFHKGRFRQEPYEWVYDGLKPLDIMDVLETNKGISLTLAVSFLGVARHLGIPMSMVPIPEGIVAFSVWSLHAHAHLLQADEAVCISTCVSTLGIAPSVAPGM